MFVQIRDLRETVTEIFCLNLLIYQPFYVIIYSIRKDVVPMGCIQSVDIKGHYI